MKCLVVNDDGTHSPGLALVEETIRARGAHCLTVAPARDQSGRGGSITLSEPLHVWTVGQDRWAVSGTPADCVRIALAYLRYQPDLIVSGVNLGSNLGDDIYASGTVGAARFGGLRGIPSCALSAASLRWELNRSLLARHWPAIVKAAESSNEVLNVNFPAFDGTRITLARLAGSRGGRWHRRFRPRSRMDHLYAFAMGLGAGFEQTRGSLIKRGPEGYGLLD